MNADPFDTSVIEVAFDNLTTDTLRQLAQGHENVDVTFIKVNGEVRVMQATLHPSVLPENEEPYKSMSEKRRHDAQGVVVVWDREKAAWRSIKPETVTQIHYVSADGIDITMKKGVVVGK
jgi:Protein of unknown function (DUF2693).